MNKISIILISLLVFVIEGNWKKNENCPTANFKYGWVQNDKAILLKENNVKSIVICKIPQLSRIDILSNDYVRIDTFEKSEKLIKVKYKNNSAWTVLGNLFPLKKIPSTAKESKDSGIPSIVNTLVLGNDDDESVKAEIPCMKNLEDLSIFSDKFVDTIDLVEELPKVKKLYVSCTDCEIPSSMGKLKNLEELWVEGGVKKIPYSIGKLKKLREIHIQESELTNIPEEIGDLPNLEILVIRGSKKLTSLPKSIGNLNSLKTISIFENNIKHFPKELEKLTNLDSYYFSDNNFADRPIPISIIIKDKFSKMEFDPRWGIGCIKTNNVPPGPPGGFPGDVFTVNKINLYDQPRGNKVGYIYKKNINIVYYLNESNKTNEQKDDLIELAYGEYYLQYYKEKSNFVQVLYNSTKKSYWLSIDELKKNSYYLMNWSDYIKKNQFNYYIIVQNGVNLREKPTVDSKIIVLMKNSNVSSYSIKLTGNYSSLWAEAIVYEKIPADCGMGKVKKEYKGWFKFLDDKLYPNIWYNPRGC